MAKSIFDELDDIEDKVGADVVLDTATLAALKVITQRQLDIAKILYARFDNVDQALRDLDARLARIEEAIGSNPEVTARIVPGEVTDRE